ncbi:kinase-like domain-containing protein, partial [Russula brevipes]
WMENGNLREYIRGNLDADRMRLLSQVASGVEFLHEEGIIHGDLCDGNILINGDGRAFVCGFGMSEFSKYVRFSGAASDLIRARWLAPERVTFASVTPPTLETDVWSFGLLCLEVFTGENPYNSYSDVFVPVLLSRGTTPEHPGSTAVGLSPRMWELMQSCWAIDPTERPSMSTIQSTIRDMLPPRFRE